MADANDRKAELLAAWRQRWRAADFTWEGLKKHELRGWVVVATDAGEVLREADSGRVYGTPLPLEGGGARGGGEGVSAASNDRSDIVQTDVHPTPLPPPPLGEGARQATLQDYWRADPATGLLRDPKEMLRAAEVICHIGGHAPLSTDYYALLSNLEDTAARDLLNASETYHIAHLPLEWDDGVRTGKADWPEDALDAIVGPRLSAASETKWDSEWYDRTIAGPDRDAQLQGSVLAKAPAHPAGRETPLSLRLNLALIFGTCDFAQAGFSGTARFESAAFGGEASFERAVFSGEARFQHAAFDEDAVFEGAAFGGDALFHNAAFSGDAEFEQVTFQSGVYFDSVTFNGGAWFANAIFNGEAEFGDAHFVERAIFDCATFASSATFQNCRFEGLAYFDMAKFQGDMNFSVALFETLSSFELISWPEAAAHWHSAFDQTLFRGTPSFVGAGLRSFAAFDGATFERGLQIDEADEATAKRTFNEERRLAIAASHIGEEATKEFKPAEIAAHFKAQREARLRELERGCRVLKLAMERAANKSREQMLYRFELQARRAQKNLPPGEALFSDLYALASDYGASMVRPFIALGVLIVVFGAIYLGWAHARGFVELSALGWQNAAWQALDLSWANVFKPLSGLSAEDTGEGTLADKLLSDAPGISFAVRALATLQSLLAIVLAFLFALAVRRRFQIS